VSVLSWLSQRLLGATARVAVAASDAGSVASPARTGPIFPLMHYESERDVMHRIMARKRARHDMLAEAFRGLDALSVFADRPVQRRFIPWIVE
jgi:hypothetical protein